MPRNAGNRSNGLCRRTTDHQHLPGAVGLPPLRPLVGHYVAAAVNEGVMFTVYFGHSGSSGWSSPGFHTSDVMALTNEGKYGIAFGWSCSSAAFTSDECFGEAWLRAPHKGAAGYLSASSFVWWGTESAWESSRRMERNFFRAFFEKNLWRVGVAWQAALWDILADPDFGPGHDHTRNI